MNIFDIIGVIFASPHMDAGRIVKYKKEIYSQKQSVTLNISFQIHAKSQSIYCKVFTNISHVKLYIRHFLYKRFTLWLSAQDLVKLIFIIFNKLGSFYDLLFKRVQKEFVHNREEIYFKTQRIWINFSIPFRTCIKPAYIFDEFDLIFSHKCKVFVIFARDNFHVFNSIRSLYGKIKHVTAKYYFHIYFRSDITLSSNTTQQQEYFPASTS